MSEPTTCDACKRPSSPLTAPIRRCLDCGQAICASCVSRRVFCPGPGSSDTHTDGKGGES